MPYKTNNKRLSTKHASVIQNYMLSIENMYKKTYIFRNLSLHENYVGPSILHQCLIYIKDDDVYCIDEEIQPFGVHDIHYNDVRYLWIQHEGESFLQPKMMSS